MLHSVTARADHVSDKIREKYVYALGSFSPEQSIVLRDTPDMETVCREILKIPFMGSLRTIQVDTILASLYGMADHLPGHRNLETKSVDSTGLCWLARIFHTSQCQTYLPNGIDKSRGMLVFWATWTVCQSFILSKFKTSMGNLTQVFLLCFTPKTLEALEQQLVDMISVAEALPEGSCASSKTLSFLSCFRNLVSLIHYLEYAVSLVAPMSSLNLPPPVVQFMAAQKSAFRDWFSRVRRRMVVASLVSGLDPTWRVYHGELYLVETVRGLRGSVRSDAWLDTFTSIFILLGQAYADIQAVDKIGGVLMWCRANLFHHLEDMERRTGFYVDFFSACVLKAKVCTISNLE